LNKEEKTSR